MRSGSSLPTWEEEGCGGILAGEALPGFVWSMGRPLLDIREGHSGGAFPCLQLRDCHLADPHSEETVFR